MDLSTTYMGLKLRTPLVPSAAGPLTADVGNIRALEDAGASAVVMFSLFEEQITHESEELDYYLMRSTHSYAEAMTYFPNLDDFNLGPDDYMELIADAKKAVDIPIIGSLNGVSLGGWTSYAEKIEQAGADGLELNLYYIPTDPEFSGEKVERLYHDVLADIKSSVSIPVAMKLSPFFSSLANTAMSLENAGADALVLFNRFYQPDIDLENLEVKPSIEFSNPYEMRLPLRWIAILRGISKMSLAATTGVRNGQSALKYLMVGADVTMVCSELLKHGAKRLTKIEQEIREWMEEHDYASIEMMKGSMSHRSCAEPAAFERANYMKTLQSFGSITL